MNAEAQPMDINDYLAWLSEIDDLSPTSELQRFGCLAGQSRSRLNSS